MTQDEVRKNVFIGIGRIAQAIASPARLKLIQMLAQAPRTVEQLSDLSGESIANTSQHLQKLSKEGLLTVKKDGIHRIYKIASPRVLRVWEELQNLSEEIAPEISEAEDLLTNSELHTSLSVEEVIRQVRTRKAVLVDVREETEAFATPVPFSLSIPLNLLIKQKSDLKKTVPVFVFCRGRFCSMATAAVKSLRAQGYKAYRLQQSSFALNRALELV